MKKAGRTKTPHAYRRRTYRSLADSPLVSTYFTLAETDLHILAESDVYAVAAESATTYRLQVERYIERHPEFLSALEPVAVDLLAPPIIRRMQGAAERAGVGPMAAVAGGIAESVARDLLQAGQREVIVENGGDIFLHRSDELTISVFAGESPLSNRLGLRILPGQMPLGICTSSGTVGHSLSFGTADSVTVLADSAFTADAAATRLGNEIGAEHEVKRAIDHTLQAAAELAGIRGVLVICDETVGAVGEIELVPLQ